MKVQSNCGTKGAKELVVDIPELADILISAELPWKEVHGNGIGIRTSFSNAYDSAGHRVESFCMVTAATYLSTGLAFHPGDYRAAAKVLGLSQEAASSLSRAGDRILPKSHPLHTPLSALVNWLLLHTSGEKGGSID